MPGRAFIGLSPDEKHPAEFNPGPLPDEPQITVLLVAIAVIVALLMIFVGHNIHEPATRSLPLIHGLCPNGSTPNLQGVACPRPNPSFWNRIPMTVWFVYAGLAAAIVIAAPFIVYAVKRSTGRV